MCYSSQWELYIKSELAYGNQQRGRHIYPGAALIFELEMLKVYSWAASTLYIGKMVLLFRSIRRMETIPRNFSNELPVRT